jgi:predicted membrane protein
MTPQPAHTQACRPASETGRPPGIRLLPLMIAIVVMLGVTAWPAALASPAGGADHVAATALFWSMSAGFVSGVGFRPRVAVLSLLLSQGACLLCLAFAAWRIAAPMI